MSVTTLTKTRMSQGVWEGVLERSGKEDWKPRLKVMHDGNTIDTISVGRAEQDRQWNVSIEIPAELLSDGIQTFLITDEETGETLESFALYCGDALAEDIRAELSLLREELDMLKRAFRRHCVETA